MNDDDEDDDDLMTDSFDGSLMVDARFFSVCICPEYKKLGERETG